MTIVSLLSYDHVESASPRFAEAFSSDPDIILDISRLLSRVMHPTPTGIDRVEMAYALGLLAMIPKRLTFAATHHTGIHGTLPTAPTVEFLHLTTKRWENRRDGTSRWSGAGTGPLDIRSRWCRGRCAKRALCRRPIFIPLPLLGPPAFPSKHLRRSRELRFIPFVHDSDPIAASRVRHP